MTAVCAAVYAAGDNARRHDALASLPDDWRG